MFHRVGARYPSTTCGTVRSRVDQGEAAPFSFGSGERLLEVRLDVVDVLDAHGHADHVGLDARRGLLRLRELLVRGGRRVDHQRLGVSHVRQVRRQLHRVDKLAPRLRAALLNPVRVPNSEYAFARLRLRLEPTQKRTSPQTMQNNNPLGLLVADVLP